MLSVLVATLAMLARPASASSPYLFTPTDEVREASPTFRYANMTNEEAYAELDRRGVPYYRMENVDGVQAPIRLDGPLHGVDVHSSLPPDQRADSIFEILDARLALSLDDFCELLARHDIVEVVHYTMYRPNGPKPESEHHAVSTRSGKRSSGKRSSAKRSSAKRLGKGSKSSKTRTAKKSSGRKQKAGGSKPRSKGKPAGSKSGKADKKSGKSDKKTAKRSSSRKASSKPARRSGQRSASSRGRKGRRVTERKEVVKSTYAPPGTRHPAGLAIDVGGLRKRDGRWLSVAHHFNGHLGARTCGPTANPPKSAEGRELWSIVCEAADLGLFTYVLTPNFDKWHADHLHMEIRGDVRWFLYH